ncbi:PB1 domain-containing protein [Tanacetum coccineum]
MPRHTDGKLRYIGGHTRVLSVNRSVTFSELSVKFFEACGFSVKLKCKLPTEDLDVLVTVECDEDLKAVVAEYDRVSPEMKIRCVCFPVKAVKTVSPVPSVESLVEYAAVKRPVRFPVVAGGCRGGLPVALYKELVDKYGFNRIGVGIDFETGLIFDGVKCSKLE